LIVLLRILKGSGPYVSDDVIRIASDSQPTNAVPVDEPSLPLPESERVDDSNPFTDPAPTAECEQPIPITDTVTEEPSTHMASQADTSAQPASVSGGYAPSRLEDKVDLPFVEAAQTSEDQQIGGLTFT